MPTTPNSDQGGGGDRAPAPQQSVGPFSDLIYTASDTCRHYGIDPTMTSYVFNLGVDAYIRLLVQEEFKRKQLLTPRNDMPTGENNGDKSGGDPAA